MTLDEIEKRLQEIRRISHDDEAAHSCEDSLLIEFIEYVVTRGGDLGAMAAKVLEVADVEFNRWCA